MRAEFEAISRLTGRLSAMSGGVQRPESRPTRSAWLTAPGEPASSGATCVRPERWSMETYPLLRPWHSVSFGRSGDF